MAITLSKGQGLSLEKSQHDLSLVTIGLGWDIAEKKTGFWGGLFGIQSPEYDLDVVAFLCDADGKVRDLGWNGAGNVTLRDSDVIFFNNLYHRSDNIRLTRDNRTGADDDEQIIVKLNSLSNDYQKIVFVVQIYDGIKNNQYFGQVDNAFIRAVDSSGKEMVRFDLSGKSYDQQRSLLFAELARKSNGCKFNALGHSSASDNFLEWLRKYV